MKTGCETSDGVAYADGELTRTVQADRGEENDLQAVLREMGAEDYIEREIERGVRERALGVAREVLFSVLFPPRNTEPKMEALAWAYVLETEGLPSMSQASDVFELKNKTSDTKNKRAALSKRCRKICELYDLSPSKYMKTAEAANMYRTTNKRKQKQ